MSFLLFLFLLILIFVLWPVLAVAAKLWRIKRQMRDAYRQFYGGQPEGSRQSARSSSARSRQSAPKQRRGKRIPPDLGEYVDFEELPYTPEPERQPVRFKRQEQVSDAEWEEIIVKKQ